MAGMANDTTDMTVDQALTQVERGRARAVEPARELEQLLMARDSRVGLWTAHMQERVDAQRELLGETLVAVRDAATRLHELLMEPS